MCIRDRAKDGQDSGDSKTQKDVLRIGVILGLNLNLLLTYTCLLYTSLHDGVIEKYDILKNDREIFHQHG